MDVSWLCTDGTSKDRSYKKGYRRTDKQPSDTAHARQPERRTRQHFPATASPAASPASHPRRYSLIADTSWASSADANSHYSTPSIPSPVRIPHTPGTPNPGTHTPGITTTRPSQNLPINLTHHALLIDILTAGPLEVEESAIETRDAGAGGGGVAMFPRGAVVGCWWGFGREGLFVCLHHRAGDAGAGAVGGMALEFVVVALAAAAAEKAEGHEGEQAERGGRGCPDPGRCLGLVCGSWCAIG